ncbi:MAG: hypothetical protein WC028_10010 [Candidatus Obscuribacterales bacterium]|jgi:hypothetical protein
MNAKSMLVVVGLLLLMAGIVLANMCGNNAWAAGIAIGAIVSTVLVAAFISGIAHREHWVVVLVFAELAGLVIIWHGGVGELIMFAMTGYVAGKIALAAALAGLGGILLACGLERK